MEAKVCFAYFYPYKGVASPKKMAINTDVNVIEFGASFMKAIKEARTTKYLYSFDDCVPMMPHSASVVPFGSDIHYYKMFDNVKLLHVHGRNTSVKDNTGEAIKLCISADLSLAEIYHMISMDIKSKSPFRIVARVAGELTSLDEKGIIEQAASGTVYLDFLQRSYSKTTNSIFDKFVWPFSSSVKSNDYYKTLTSDHDTTSAFETAQAFIAVIHSDLTCGDAERVRKAELWDLCVTRATHALEDWSQTIPLLSKYNEATRRLLINEVALQTCKFQGETLLVEPYLCYNQRVLPSHFVGGGPLDYLLGLGKRTCLEVYPTPKHTAAAAAATAATAAAAAAAAAAVAESDTDSDEEQGEVAEDHILEVEEGDPLSRSVVCSPSSTDVEAKREINQAALRQLLAQIYDKAYVDEDTIITIANSGVEICDTTSATATGTTTPGVAHGKVSTTAFGTAAGITSNKRQLDSSSDVYAVRKNLKLSGVLTTGQTWQFFRFSFASAEEMLDPHGKLTVEFAGTLKMPVLQYSGENIGSGLTSKGKVSRDDVELVMAALLTFNTNTN